MEFAASGAADVAAEEPPLIANLPPPLLRLSADATIYLIEFLSTEDLMCLSGACVQLQQTCRADPVWAPRLLIDLGIVDHVTDLPPLISTLPPSAFSAFSAYLSWRQEFQGYPLSLVRRVKTWWQRIEKWLLANFNEIHATLRAPLTEARIIALTKDPMYPNFAIPPVLRLMYRFHDGQSIRGQDRLLHDTTQEAEIESQAEFLATGYGLFGGVSFYETFTNCYLLPLEDLVVLNCATSHYRDDTTDYTARISSLFLTESPSGVRDLPGRGRAAEYTLFAVNTLGISPHPTPEKGFFVGRVAAKDNNVVYTNCKGCVPVDDDLILTPCLNNAECNKARADREPAMLRWLFEYLHRLEQGVYRVEPREMPLTTLEQQRKVHESQRTAAHYQITLFKHGPSSEARVTNGVELTGHPYLVTQLSLAGDRALHDIADPNYTPAQAGNAQQTLFWTYSIRMRLLEDHHSRPPLLSAAQLVSRHWVINEPDQPPSIVNGPGVVGHTPMLLADRRLPFAFSYQSCTEGRKPQVFDGSIKFRCASGSLRREALPGPAPVLRDTKGREVPGEDSFFADLPRLRLNPLQDSYFY